MTQDELYELDAKEVKFAPKDAEFLGTIMMPYGDMNYYKTKDGEYVREYFSIGD